MDSFATDSVAGNVPGVYDHFEDGNIGPIWRAQTKGSGASTIEQGGQLVIDLPAKLEGNDPDHLLGGGLVSTCRVTGNFDLTVGYSLLKWPANSGARVALMVSSAPEASQLHGVARVSFGADDFYGEPSDVYFYYDAGSVAGITESDAHVGRLRLTRWDGLLVGYYRQGSDWVQLSSSRLTEPTLTFSIGVWTPDYAFTHQEVKAAFDDVSLTGDVECPVEPTATPTATATVTHTPTPTPTPSPTITPKMTPTPQPEPSGASGSVLYLPALGNAPN
jgi:hypothetical protein